MRNSILRSALGAALLTSAIIAANGCSSSEAPSGGGLNVQPPSSSKPPTPGGKGTLPVAQDKPATTSLEPAPTDGDANPPGCVVVRQGAQAVASADEGVIAPSTIGHRILYLNRNGGDFYPGPDNSSRNTSTLVRSPVRVPAYRRSNTQWAQLLAASQAEYAPYDITVTDVDPGAVAHVEVVVSGSPSMIGQPSTAAGISPLAGDCTVIERSIVFAFDDLLYDVNDQMRVVTHEAGHSFGLDHEFFCQDTMSYLFTCAAPKHFQNGNQYCGEYSARACACGGYQDTVSHLMAVLGPHVDEPPPKPPTPDAGTTTTDDGGAADSGTTTTTGPVVTALMPADGGTALGNNTALAVTATVTSTGATPAKAVLQWELNGAVRSFDCDAMPSNMSCARNGDTVTWTLSVGTGLRTWHVDATSNGVTTSSPARTVVLNPAVATGPTAVVSSPAANTAYTAGATVPVRVDVLNDRAGISQVWLTWTAPSGQVQYPLTYLGGTAWGLDVTTTAGAQKGNRTLQITAYEPNFATVNAAPVTITLQ